MIVCIAELAAVTLALTDTILFACVAALLNKVVMLVVAVPRLASNVLILVACAAALLTLLNVRLA